MIVRKITGTRMLIGLGVVAMGAMLAACGSGAAANPTPTVSATPAASGQRRFGNGTPSAALETSIAEGTPAPFAAGRSDIQTSIAEGTPAPFGGRGSDIQTSIAEGTPAPFGRGAAIQTSIAEGTPAPFGGPPSDVQTAIAEGTRPAGGFGGGIRILGILATVLNVPNSQLQTELQASGATIATVGAAHGYQRAALGQALIDAYKQRTAMQVQNGTITQDQADQANSQFTSNIDSLLDSKGTNPPAPAGGQ